MGRHVLAPGARPCVWMSAGVLRYRLCPGDRDCAHCPLDAALRGEGFAYSPRVRGPVEFPDDRRYGPGHTWVQPLESTLGSVWRVGVDALASDALAAAPGPLRIRSWAPGSARVRLGGPLCTLELGGVPIDVSTPVAARVVGMNPRVLEDPWCLVASPYGEGWLVELSPDDPAAFVHMGTSAAARARVTQDLFGLFRAEGARSATPSHPA